jgi:hypothetical protein
MEHKVADDVSETSEMPTGYIWEPHGKYAEGCVTVLGTLI